MFDLLFGSWSVIRSLFSSEIIIFPAAAATIFALTSVVVRSIQGRG